MAKTAGKNLSLSLPRITVCDLVHFARQVPTVPVQRRMRLAAVVAARRTAAPRPSWCTVFTKAYAQVCAETAELRRAYMSFPRPRLYEHPTNVATITVERRYQNENAVFFGHIREPEKLPLLDIDSRLDHMQRDSVESIGSFRHSLFVSKLPRPIRRLGWWLALNCFGSKRARKLGTFAVSVYSGLGAESLHPLSPLTSVLNYGVIDEDGRVDVRIIYDHRVLDGATVARALGRLEAILTTSIVQELDGLTPSAFRRAG